MRRTARTRHAVASFAVNAAGRDFVTGDVHGCFRTLAHALSAVGFNAECDRLFGVGDLVDRGPHSAEALEWLERRFAAVALGNHERAVRSWFEAKPPTAPPAGSDWLRAIAPHAFGRWRVALRAMPVAITIETVYGPVGIVHAESPHRVWTQALDLLESGSPSAVDDALLGLPVTKSQRAGTRAGPVEGLRALLHGHEPVEAVECSANRWNLDTGAGVGRFNRLSLLEVNLPAFCSWTFDVREFR